MVEGPDAVTAADSGELLEDLGEQDDGPHDGETEQDQRGNTHEQRGCLSVTPGCTCGAEPNGSASCVTSSRRNTRVSILRSHPRPCHKPPLFTGGDGRRIPAERGFRCRPARRAVRRCVGRRRSDRRSSPTAPPRRSPWPDRPTCTCRRWSGRRRCAAVSASISTPVRSTVSTWASTSMNVSSIRKLTSTAPTSTRVAQRDQVRRPLGGLDPGHPGHRQHVALVDGAAGHERGGLGAHVDPPPCDGPAMRGLLGCDVDHASTAEWVEMGQAPIGHGRECRPSLPRRRTGAGSGRGPITRRC